MNLYLKETTAYLQNFDINFEKQITLYLSSHNLQRLSLFISFHTIILAIKIAFYSLIPLIILTILKISLQSKWITFMLIIVGAVFSLSTFVVFLGFFQILFS